VDIPVSIAPGTAAAASVPAPFGAFDAPLEHPLPAEVSPTTSVMENVITAPLIQEPAAIRLVAIPWAKVTVDERPGFHTPRAAPIELAPGRHTIVFEHPTYGRAETVLDLEAGELRTVRHDFDEGDPS
jgi:hypothetical protein